MSTASAGANRYWWFQLAFWGGYWVLNLAFARAWGYASGLINVTFVCLSLAMLALTHGYHRIYVRRYRQQPIARIALQLLWLLPASALAIQIGLAAAIVLLFRVFPDRGEIGPGGSLGALIGYTMNTCIILIVWCLVYLLHAEWTKRRAAEREHWQNEIRLREVELQFLRSQVNSHFLFNALNNIRSLILEDAEAARRALTHLATLLRGLMNNESRVTVSLREETEWVKGYLALEALQFERRLTYELVIAPELLDAQLPPLLLQTLAENAIRHGIARRQAGGCVRIAATALPASRWRLEVVNPPADLPATHAGSGIGLNNARARLQAAFGDGALLELTLSREHVVAAAEMPL